MRETSNHKVSVLDFTKLKELSTKFFRSHGQLAENEYIDTMSYGIVEKDGKHYLLNTEGVGSPDALEDTAGRIYWYKSYKNENGVEGHECSPFAYGEYFFYELMEHVTVKEVVILNEFIRTFGSRLDENFQQWSDFLNGYLVVVEE